MSAFLDLNIGFHQAIIALSTSQLLATMTESLLIPDVHYLGADHRRKRPCVGSTIDHMNVMKALEDRGADPAECVSREHTSWLAAYVEKNVTYLDEGQLSSGLTKKCRVLGAVQR